MSFANSIGGGVVGLTNAAANTVFYAVIPGRTGAYTRICGFNWTAGNTANSFVGLRPIGRTTITTAAITNVAVVTLTADPSPTGNTIAAGDQVVIAHSDGTYRRAQVNTAGWCSTDKTLTFTANLAANVAAGAKIWMFGVPADTDPITGSAFPVFPTVANTTYQNNFVAAGFVGAQTGDPLMLYNANATNATLLNNCEYAFTRE